MVLTREQLRAAEQAAVTGGITWMQLMDNAGCAAAKQLTSHFAVNGSRITILCGKGNNGGDGFVIARELTRCGACVTVLLTAGEPQTPQAKSMFALLPASVSVLSYIPDEPSAAKCLADSALIVDAVYGIGFRGTLPDFLRPLFRKINQSDVPVVAIDIPSGMETDSAVWDKDTLKAKRTITFTALKPAFIHSAGENIFGEIEVVAISIPETILSPYRDHAPIPVTFKEVQECFPKRFDDTNKGSFGRALLLCGSPGMAGAAVLAASAALRCGAGLTELALPASLYPIAAAHLCEPVFTLLPETENYEISPAAVALFGKRLQAATAVGLGCGLGTSPGAAALVLAALTQAVCPVVLDADALNILARHLEILNTVQVPVILTPHPGEMSRLTGKTVAEIQADRASISREFSEKYNVIVALKGHGTLIAVPGKTPFVNPTGNPGMATGGSGDLLTGMIVSFLAQGFSPADAALCGVYLHGLAGDNAAARLSQHAMLPTDILAELPGIFCRLEHGEENPQ